MIFGVSRPELVLGLYLDCTCYCNALTMQTALLHPHPHPRPLHLDACPLARHQPDRKSDLLQTPESRFLILPPIHLPLQICSESAGTGDIHVQALSRRLSRRFAALSTQLHPPAPTSTRVPALNPQYSHLCRLTALAAQRHYLGLCRILRLASLPAVKVQLLRGTCRAGTLP